MTSFCILHLLEDDRFRTLSVEVDNAVGHGNHQEEARRINRQRSREQSQHYMCRKPQRTAEDYPITRVPMPTPISRDKELCYSPNTVTDTRSFDTLTKNSYADNCHRNALKPVRQSSLKELRSVIVTEDWKPSPRENHRLGYVEMSSLANILSTLEL